MLHKLFFETKMTWKRVILFAIITAVLTAVLLMIPIFNDTSFQNIGVTFECWILFALIIIINCEKPLEAGLKTFVFFHISQPLIYLLQVPFYIDGWEIFQYYPRWFIWTILCFPGGIIAWYVKKDNLLSAIILSVATGFLGAEFIYFADQCLNNFPKNLITVIFIAVLIVILILVLLHNKRNRIIAALITLICAIAAFIIFISSAAQTPEYKCILDYNHTWDITSQDGDVADVVLDPKDENIVIITAKEYGTEKVTVTNEVGDSVVLIITNDEVNGLTVDSE